MDTYLAPAWQLLPLAPADPVPDLSHYRGRPLLLLFFNKGCQGCVGRGLPLAKYFQKKFPQIQVIGIHVNFHDAVYPPAEVMELYHAQHLNFPLFLDPDAATYIRYEGEGTPHWVFVDEQGRIINSIFGSMQNAQNRLYYQLTALFGEQAS